MLDRDRFNALLTRLSGRPAPEGAFARVLAAYGETHRRYHDEAHVASCLAELDKALGIAERPDELELALWLHDVVYDPRGERNEEESAQWAADLLREIGVGAEVIGRVNALILATGHREAPATADEALLGDIDLAVLGQEADAYGAYEAGIREEYDFVPEALFRRARAGILQGFLDRDSIYRTERFRARYERAARENLRRALLRLSDVPEDTQSRGA